MKQSLRPFLMSKSSFFLVKFLSSFLKTLLKLDFFSFLMSFFKFHCQVFPEKTWHRDCQVGQVLSNATNLTINDYYIINVYLYYNDYIINSSVSVREIWILSFVSDNLLLFIISSYTFWYIYHVLYFLNTKFTIFDISNEFVNLHNRSKVSK